MRKQIIFLLLLLLLVSRFAASQIINGRFSTAFYTFEKYDTVGESKTYLRGFQTAQFDVTQKNLSFHTSLQATTNFTLITGEQKNLKIYNVYFNWKNIYDIIDLSVGRHSVYAGVGHGLIDGGTVKMKLFENRVAATVYGGGNVNPDLEAEVTKRIKDNYLVGAQVISTIIPDMRIGLSYMNRHRERISYTATRPDSIGLPVQRLIEVASPSEQYAGADVSYSLKSLARFYGRYEHDLNMMKVSRAQFGARVYMTKEIAVTGDYIYRQPRISYNSIFQVFNQSSNSEIEGGLEYSYSPMIHLFGKFASVQYSGDNSQRYTLGLNVEYGSLVYSGNTGYAGELNSLSAQLMYPLFDNVLTPTIGISRSSYKMAKQSDRLDTFTGLFGATVRPSQSFSLDSQIQWMNNPVYKNDVRFLIKINYLFTQRLNIL